MEALSGTTRGPRTERQKEPMHDTGTRLFALTLTGRLF